MESDIAVGLFNIVGLIFLVAIGVKAIQLWYEIGVMEGYGLAHSPDEPDFKNAKKVMDKVWENLL